MTRQPTMADIAQRAGVSRVAVSYALNGRPGVSERVRERILRIAEEIGFNANSAARILQGATVQAVGMTMRRPTAALIAEAFRREFIAGAQRELMAREMGLALQFVSNAGDEIGVYRRWGAERRVGGVLVSDLESGDPRVPALEAIGLPFVIVGAAPAGSGTITVTSDEAAALVESLEYLFTLGHRRVARVSGPSELLHTAQRDRVFRRACRKAGVHATIVAADYTGEAGAQLTRRLLSSRPRPSAIVYDNDVMAVAGLSVASEMRLLVPRDLSIIAWQDSPLCQVVRPALTVLSRDVTGLGALAVRVLLSVIDGETLTVAGDRTATLIVRGSTGPLTDR